MRNHWLKLSELVTVPAGIEHGFIKYDQIKRSLIPKLVEYWASVYYAGIISREDFDILIDQIKERTA